MKRTTKKSDFYAVIMAGGTGTRLWPVSRKEKPKQFQKFTSSRTMIQETYERVAKVVPRENIFVSTTEMYKSIVLEQLPELKEAQLIIEPLPRGTAPAIALVAKSIYKLNPKAVVATIASDHAIKNVDEFVVAISAALLAVERHKDKLVTIGINPSFADTGMGYIKMGKEFSSIGKKRIFYVDSFVEKPDKKTAEKYLAGWEYLWNAGYFIFSAKGFLDITKKLMPGVSRTLEKISKLNEKNPPSLKLRRVKEIEKIYAALKNEPIDTAVAEKLEAKKDWLFLQNWNGRMLATGDRSLISSKTAWILQ